MNLRKALLATMLWSLGLAAVAGVCAALFVRGRIVEQLIGTGIISAVTAGLLMALGLLVNREKTRAGGLMGMSVVLVECLLGLTLIWGQRASFRYNSIFESIASTMGAIALFGIPATFFLLFGDRWSKNLSTRIALFACGGGFLLALLGAWSGYPIEGMWWQSSIIVGGYGMLGALGVMRVPTREWSWRWIGIGCAIAATLVGMSAAWDHRGREGEWLLVAISGAGAAVAYVNLSLKCPMRIGQGWVRVLSIAAAMLTALLIDASGVAKWQGMWGTSEFCGRAAGAAGVVAACGALAMVILSRLNRRTEPGQAEQKLTTAVALTCPHCNTKQTLPTGDSVCAHCGLRFHIQLEEPRCSGCGYLLYMLKGDRCPECGIQLHPPSSGARSREERGRPRPEPNGADETHEDRVGNHAARPESDAAAAEM